MTIANTPVTLTRRPDTDAIPIVFLSKQRTLDHLSPAGTSLIYDNVALGNVALDNMASDNAGADKAGADNARADNAGADSVGGRFLYAYTAPESVAMRASAVSSNTDKVLVKAN